MCALQHLASDGYGFTLTVMLLAGRAQARGGVFRRHVALRRAEHLEADHELAHGRRPQQRRIEVRVQVPLVVRLAVATAAGGSPSNRETASRTDCRSACVSRFRMSASASRSADVRSSSPPTWRRGRTIVSNGHTAQNGTSATNASFSQTRRSPRASSSARDSRTADRCRARRDTRAAPPARAPARSGSWRSPRSARADADCSRPSRRRGSRRSGRSRCQLPRRARASRRPTRRSTPRSAWPVHARQRQIVARREADDAADAALSVRATSRSPTA